MSDIFKHRIVSLIASSTETICALGFENLLVGRSHECDYPHSTYSLSVCSKPKFDIKGSSADIDTRVKQVLEQALSVYEVDVQKLEQLQPTVIVTQDHCEVCAVSLKDVENAACNFLFSKPQIVSLFPNTIKDIFDGFKQIATAVGNIEVADKLINTLEQQIKNIQQKIQAISMPKPRVAILEWIDPIWTSGGWIPELVDIAGAIDVIGTKGTKSKGVTFEYLENANPQYIIIAPCGYDIPKAIEELPPLINHPRWKLLNAVKQNKVYIADGNQYFNRPSPRMIDSVEILTEILYPNHFYPIHKTDWIQWK